MFNISRSKGKRTMKFSQLMEHRNNNVILQKSWRKWGRETNSRPLLILQKTFTWDKRLSILVLTYFGGPWFGHRIKFVTFQTVDPEVCSILIFRIASGNSFSTTFCVWFFKKKMFLVLYSINWANCLIAFTSWDIGQYVYCDYLIIRLWRHKSWN